jgi:hypothetical protein
MWESGCSPQSCEGCEECGTTFSTHPDYHDEIQPHHLEKRFDERTGEPNGTICIRCYKRFNN